MDVGTGGLRDASAVTQLWHGERLVPHMCVDLALALDSDGTAPIAARNPLRYRAYYLDTETGLYYLPARYYDPATARFLSPDPAPPSAGDPGSLNAYAYCGDDPVGATDPSGAISDIEAESWRHYYTGNRRVAEAASYRLRHNINYRRRMAQRAYIASARTRGLHQAREAAMQGQLDGRDKAFFDGIAAGEQAAPNGGALNVLAGGLAGLSAMATTVSAVAGTVALAAGTAAAVTSPAAATGGGAIIPGSAAAVAANATAVSIFAGVLSIAAGVAYSAVTDYRVRLGEIDASDPRANGAAFAASMGSGFIGLASSSMGPGAGLLGIGCAWGVAAVEWTSY